MKLSLNEAKLTSLGCATVFNEKFPGLSRNVHQVPVQARQSQVTKVGRKTTSALEPQNSFILNKNLWVSLKRTTKA